MKMDGQDIELQGQKATDVTNAKPGTTVITSGRAVTGGASGRIKFMIADKEVMSVGEDGDFIVNGRHVIRDIEVYDGLVEWIKRAHVEYSQ